MPRKQGPRTQDQRRKDGRNLTQQIDRLKDKDRVHRFQQEIINSVRNRRNRHRDFDIEEFDTVGEGFLLARRGEILVRADDQAKAATELGTDFAAAPVTELDNRVVRFTNNDLSVTELAERAAQLSEPTAGGGAGIDATVNYVVPLGYVAKAEGGFEKTQLDSGFDWPDVDTGRGVRVAVVDTGITAEMRSDEWLSTITRVAGGMPNGGGLNGNIDPLYLRDQPQPPAPQDVLDFAAGHGTFVVGVIQQLAPMADIQVYRAVGSDGVGGELDIASAMLSAARGGAQVINLSLGTETHGDRPPVGLAVALEMLAERHPDVLVVVAAGNSGSDRPMWPGAFAGGTTDAGGNRREYPNVVAVASVRAGLPLTGSEWSTRGPWVRCSVVGEGVVSTYVKGHESKEVDPDDPEVFGRDSWAVGTGTSFAAPQITGEVAAVMSQNAGLSPRDALDQVLQGATAVAGYGVCTQILDGTSRVP
jgi:hypothetical protein